MGFRKRIIAFGIFLIAICELIFKIGYELLIFDNSRKTQIKNAVFSWVLRFDSNDRNVMWFERKQKSSTGH